MPSGTFSDCWLLCHVYVLFFQFLVLLGASGAQSCLLTLALSHTMCTIGYYAIRMFGHLTLVTLPFDLFDLVFINFVQ